MKKFFIVFISVIILSSNNASADNKFEGLLECGELNIYVDEYNRKSTVNGIDYHLKAYPDRFSLSMTNDYYEKKPDKHIAWVTIHRVYGFASFSKWEKQNDGSWNMIMADKDCKAIKRKF